MSDASAAQNVPETFPLRIAVIDMGSNAIRFLAGEFSDEESYERLAADRRPVRLGHGVYLSGRLDPRAMDGAVTALIDFKARMDELGISEYRAAATSAVRESKNSEEFIERVFRESGLVLDMISGSEEARLVHLAVSKKIDLGSDQWLLADLGGGSVEVSLVDQEGTFWSESHTMGSVRLLEELTEAGADPGRFRRLLSEYISVLHVPAAVKQDGVRGYIATGGNIETLAKLGGYQFDEGVTSLSLENLRAIIEQLVRLSYHERVAQLGLREDRADVVLPAALVYLRLGELCGAEEIVVPHVGVKEGLLYDLATRLTRHRDHEDQQARRVLAGALTIGRKYMFDEAHARQVTELALSIFDQTGDLHQLGDAERKLLHAAALLHDIGQFVSFKGHHKHSLYLISNSELPSFSAREMRVVANIARYHRKAHPAGHHDGFVALKDADQERVYKLGAILRLADSLDREHVQRVREVTVSVGADVVELMVDGPGSALLEGWSLRKKAQLFKEVFARPVQIRFRDVPE